MPLRLVLATLLGLSSLCAAARGAEGPYDLHEWGVFKVSRNDAWAQRDMKEEWASFPKFFYRMWPERHLPWRGAVDKPVIFFHAEKAVKLQFTVTFATGKPLVWWPAASSPGEAGGLEPVGQPNRIVWYVDLQAQGQGFKASHEVPEGHWVQKLRAVAASAIQTYGDASNRRGGDQQEESFVYYDGIFQAPAGPKVARGANALVFETNSDHAWLDVLVIDRREKETFVGKAWTAKIEAGKQSTKVELVSAGDAKGEKETIERLRRELTDRLSAAGLNKDEAESLVKVWDEGFFARPGLTLLYRVPQETYEKWLPLTANPAPKKCVRVGLVLHTSLEPELEATVETQIKKLADEKFEVRDAARKLLAQIGGAAFPQLEKHFSDPDVETAKTCRAIVEGLDTKPALNAKK